MTKLWNEEIKNATKETGHDRNVDSLHGSDAGQRSGSARFGSRPGIGGPGPEAPHTPAGTAIIGNNIWVGDEAQSFRHYIPVDPNNADPLNTGQLQFDNATNWSIGGGSCFLWCSVGQVAQDGSSRAYLAVYDRPKGQPFNPGGGGIWKVEFQSDFTFGPFAQVTPVAFSFGLAGDLTIATARGPEGKLYVGFLKNGNIKRITNPAITNPTPQNQTVEFVGTTPSGRPMRAMTFLGADLYVATDQGLAIVRNVATCVGNAAGCGNAVPVVDGLGNVAHVGLTTDGATKVYFSVAGSVYRYTPADKLCRQSTTSPAKRFVGNQLPAGEEGFLPIAGPLYRTQDLLHIGPQKPRSVTYVLDQPHS
jgi:hypothetical protein